MRQTISRYRPVIIAVTIGVCFLTAVLTFNDSLWKTTEANLRGAFGDYTYVATDSGRPGPNSPIDADLTKSVGKVEGVEDVEPSVHSIGFVKRGTLKDPVQLHSLDWLGEGAKLVDGKYPDGDGEVLLDASVASDWGFSPGDEISVLSTAVDEDSTTATVSGLVELPDSSVPGSSTVMYGTVDAINKIRGVPADSYSNLLIKADDSRSTLEAINAVSSARDKSPSIEPVEDFIQSETRSSLPGARNIQMGIVAVSIAAFLVLVLVIRSVYTVRIEQDRRDYSLRRCLGATRGQIFMSVLGSATATGFVGAAIGAGLAVAIAAAVLAIPAVPISFGVSVASVIGALLAGTLICIIGALGPARQAMRNTALGALRESTSFEEGGRRRIPWKRTVALVVTFAVLVFSAYIGALVVTIAVAVLVIILGLTLVRPVTHWVAGLLLRISPFRRSIPISEALERIHSNSVRAASITSLTAITVAFVALIGAGSASTLASMNKEFTDVPSPDISIKFDQNGVSSDEILQAADSVDAVESGTVVKTRTIDIDTDYSKLEGATAVEITPELERVVHEPKYLDQVQNGTVFLGKQFDAGPGDNVVLHNSSGSRELKADVREEGTDVAFLKSEDFNAIGGSTQSQVWIKFADGSDTKAAVAELSNVLSSYPVSYRGTSQQLAEIQDYIGLLSLVAMLLLAVGVIIALVGISNTLRVSVIERTQEIGLQRALGALRSDIRLSLVMETVVLTVLGAVLGAAGGTVIAVTGVYSLAASTSGLRFDSDIPIGFLAIVLTVTAGVGVCASLIAARRAVRISPVQAIVSE